jgi:PTH1 family peptidyl-tRNA hydrolase
MAEPWLVAGLGNPGERYANTRHNLGAMVTARLADRFGARFKKARFVPLLVAEARPPEGVALYLTQPLVFMNEGGPPVASFARKRDVGVDHVIAVHDEIDLPFGALRIKRGGSTAGHHGLDSLVQAFRSPDFYRIRVGVGRPPGRGDPIDYVLSPFSKRQREEVEVLIEDGADAVVSLITDGLARTQDRFNRAGTQPSSGPGM